MTELSKQEIESIREAATKKYPVMVINLMAGMPPSDFNYAERQACIAEATEQAIKAKELVEALEEIAKPCLNMTYEKEIAYNKKIAKQALLNYKP